jgi:hypothetical protein
MKYVSKLTNALSGEREDNIYEIGGARTADRIGIFKKARLIFSTFQVCTCLWGRWCDTGSDSAIENDDRSR